MLDDLTLALMVKHSDPLQYYSLKQQKKLMIHDASYKSLHKLTRGRRHESSNEREDEDMPGGEDGGSFRSKMFDLLEKTNQRVQLDRPFLIREKMQVIMVDSEKQTPKNADLLAERQKKFIERKQAESTKKERSSRAENNMNVGVSIASNSTID